VETYAFYADLPSDGLLKVHARRGILAMQVPRRRVGGKLLT
jgi:hypothetical protein